MTPPFFRPGSFLIKIPAIILLILLMTSFCPPGPNKVSMKMEAKMLSKGKAMIINAEVFYQFDQGRMITHYTSPQEYLYLTNAKGEAKIYYPSSNEVFLKQSAEFDPEKGLLYFFLSNRIGDLGLRDLGFKITDTKFEEGLSITSWFPPPPLLRTFSRVELVHEDYQPIYIAYWGTDKKMIKKIFYYDYITDDQFTLPTKVVEINYLPKGDSTINKITYSDIKSGSKANSSYFNFKVPVNAKVKSN